MYEKNNEDDFVRISKLPGRNEKFNFQEENSKHIKEIMVGVAIGLAVFGGTMAINVAESQSMVRATEIVYETDVEIPKLNGYKLLIQRNGVAFFEDQNGRKAAKVNDIDANNYAKYYIENGMVNFDEPKEQVQKRWIKSLERAFLILIVIF